MRDATLRESTRPPRSLSPNARVSLALAALSLAFYVAIVLNHLPP